MWFYNIFPYIMLSDSSNKKLSKYENNLEFQNNFCNLLNIAMYTFKFTGLPETCNERFFKLNLLLRGCAALIKDDELGFLSLGVTPNSGYNMYGEVDKLNAYGWNGFNRSYKNYIYGSINTDAQAIICRDNDLCYPFINYLIIAAKRLSDCMRTIDVTAKKLKTPYFIICDEAQRTSVKKILEDIDFNQDSIIANKATMPNQFQVLQTGCNPESLRALWEHYSNLESEIRTTMGINSAANLDKTERLVVDEAEANDVITAINLEVRLKSYEFFCQTVNDYFGLSISVENNIKRVEKEEHEDAATAYFADRRDVETSSEGEE